MCKNIIKKLFNHKFQESSNPKCICLTFVMLGGKWYADIPE